ERYGEIADLAVVARAGAADRLGRVVECVGRRAAAEGRQHDAVNAGRVPRQVVAEVHPMGPPLGVGDLPTAAGAAAVRRVVDVHLVVESVADLGQPSVGAEVMDGAVREIDLRARRYFAEPQIAAVPR